MCGEASDELTCRPRCTSGIAETGLDGVDPDRDLFECGDSPFSQIQIRGRVEHRPAEAVARCVGALFDERRERFPPSRAS